MKPLADTLVVFSHGKESGPRGAKITALMAVAESEGARAVSIDYREHPPGVTHDHHQSGEAGRRVRQLLATALPKARRTVLVGSSMGGYVSTVAATHLPVDGLFLLAPAFYLPGYDVQDLQVQVGALEIVHGWGDDVVPWANSARFASKHRCTLHMIDGDHRLDGSLPLIEELFRAFLRRLAD